MATDRLALLCGQDTLTGIDFVTIEDPSLQTTLRVYFLLDPQGLDGGAGWNTAPTPAEVRIWAPSGGRSVVEPTIDTTQFATEAGRTYLEITVEEPGDFSLYRLEIDHARLDYYYKQADFSFKQACPTTLDCKLVAPDDSCPEPDDGVELNPLARDFVSLRRALLDYAGQKFPTWTYRSDADVGVMLIELMAAMGDEFNYIKDRLIREGALDELSQRRSLRHLTRLIDYEIHDGRSPSTVLELDVVEGEGQFDVDAGTQVWAQRLGEAPITFEIGEGIADYRDEVGDPRSFLVDEAWNTIVAHDPDGSAPRLAKGATELFLVGDFAAWQLPKLIVLHEDPSDGSAPKRHLVHVTAVEPLVDALDSNLGISRVSWDASEALPCSMLLADMSAKANVVPATAGESFEEFFWIRGDGSDDAPDAIERQGPLDALTASRNPLFRHSPTECEAQGLGWLGQLSSSTPEIEIQTVDGDDAEWSLSDRWSWRRTLLDSTPRDAHFTIEDGTWRRVVGYRKPDGDEFVHRDWAANAGYTVRFGDGEFGQIPEDGARFRVRYRTGPGAAANLNAGTIVHLVHPITGTPPQDPKLAAVSNPFALSDGVDPEDMQRAKFLAPEAYRHETLNAVTPADYKRLAQSLAWVSQANATFRWTGSWLTIFVSADPLGAFSMSADQRGELEDLMDCVRQVGRDVHVLEPDYIDLDLRITVCPAPGAYAGQTEAAILGALTGPDGFFAADNFSFGTPLLRSALEAAVQTVPGVHAVERIDLRAREKTGWIEFDEVAFQVGAEQIIRLVNDPRLPEQGTVVVTVREVV